MSADVVNLYPVTMSRHGPSRSLAEYLAYLYAELGSAPIRSARALDLTARIRAIEDELNSRAGGP